MSRFLVCDGGPGRVVDAVNGAAALVACGYAYDTREAAVFDLASDRALDALSEALGHAQALADRRGDETTAAKVEELSGIVGRARAGGVSELRRCVFLYEEMRDAECADEEWP